jgi:hypothetical protein
VDSMRHNKRNDKSSDSTGKLTGWRSISKDVRILFLWKGTHCERGMTANEPEESTRGAGDQTTASDYGI